MAIFGFNGLSALALDFALIFAVYGMKEVALTKKQVPLVSRYAERKRIAGLGTKSEKESAYAQFRAQVIADMRAAGAGRYPESKEFETAYGKKTWLR